MQAGFGVRAELRFRFQRLRCARAPAVRAPDSCARARPGRRQRGFSGLAFGDVEIDTAVPLRLAVWTADYPAPAENPAYLSIGANDPVLVFVRIDAAVERVLEPVDHSILVIGVAQRADGTRSVRGRWWARVPLMPEELGGRPDQPGCEVDAPDADARRLLGQRQRLVTERVVGQPFDERVAPLCRGSRGGSTRRSRGVSHVASTGPFRGDSDTMNPAGFRAPFRARATWNGDAPDNMIKQAQVAILLALACLAPPASAGNARRQRQHHRPRAARRVEDVVARLSAPTIRMSRSSSTSTTHESYKKAIRNWLTGAPPDVVYLVSPATGCASS